MENCIQKEKRGQRPVRSLLLSSRRGLTAAWARVVMVHRSNEGAEPESSPSGEPVYVSVAPSSTKGKRKIKPMP